MLETILMLITFIAILLAWVFGVMLPAIFSFVEMYLPMSKKQRQEEAQHLEIVQKAIISAFHNKDGF